MSVWSSSQSDTNPSATKVVSPVGTSTTKTLVALASLQAREIFINLLGRASGLLESHFAVRVACLAESLRSTSRSMPTSIARSVRSSSQLISSSVKDQFNSLQV